MLNKFKKTALFAFSLLVVVSCSKEIDDLKPINQDTADEVFADPASYKSFLAKIYAGIALSGQQGPAGNPDIAGDRHLSGQAGPRYRGGCTFRSAHAGCR